MYKTIIILFLFVSSIQINAQNWETLGNGLNVQAREFYVDTITNRLYAIGFFTMADDTIPVNNVAYWDGAQWNDLDSGNTECPSCNPIHNIYTFQSDVYLGGSFTSFHNVPNTRCIVRYNGINWESIGNANGPVQAFYDYNNQLLVLGNFDTIGGINAKGLAL